MTDNYKQTVFFCFFLAWDQTRDLMVIFIYFSLTYRWATAAAIKIEGYYSKKLITTVKSFVLKAQKMFSKHN